MAMSPEMSERERIKAGDVVWVKAVAVDVCTTCVGVRIDTIHKRPINSYAKADAIIASRGSEQGVADIVEAAAPYRPQAIHYEGQDVLEYISRDVPSIVRSPAQGGVDILLDQDTREPIGWRIYGWSRVMPARGSDPAVEGMAEALEACDFGPGDFSFYDDPGEHDPCYVVLPGGAMIPLNHHVGEGVDVARAKFIIAACNAALSAYRGGLDLKASRDLSHTAVPSPQMATREEEG